MASFEIFLKCWAELTEQNPEYERDKNAAQISAAQMRFMREIEHEFPGLADPVLWDATRHVLRTIKFFPRLPELLDAIRLVRPRLPAPADASQETEDQYIARIAANLLTSWAFQAPEPADIAWMRHRCRVCHGTRHLPIVGAHGEPIGQSHCPACVALAQAYRQFTAAAELEQTI